MVHLHPQVAPVALLVVLLVVLLMMQETILEGILREVLFFQQNLITCSGSGNKGMVEAVGLAGPTTGIQVGQFN